VANKTPTSTSDAMLVTRHCHTPVKAILHHRSSFTSSLPIMPFTRVRLMAVLINPVEISHLMVRGLSDLSREDIQGAIAPSRMPKEDNSNLTIWTLIDSAWKAPYTQAESQGALKLVSRLGNILPQLTSHRLLNGKLTANISTISK